MKLKLDWPGRCSSCGETIEDWSAAATFNGGWMHKRCWRPEDSASATADLRSPLDSMRQLEWPMLFFLLLFHFGLGTAVIGWIFLDQGRDEITGLGLLAAGIITPVIGVAGVALNVLSRRHVEMIRQDLESHGGWSPGL